MQVSILIPTRNRCEAVRETLRSLRETDHQPGDHEIIVIDNGSTDATRAVVEQEMASQPHVRYVYEPIPGLLSGRHRGAQEAAGEICAYLDDDVWVGREWLAGLQDAFRDPNVALVGGPSTPRYEGEPPDWLPAFFTEDERGRYCGWLSLVECGNQIKDIDPCLVWGLNYAIRKPVLFSLGGFHPDTMPKALQRYQGDGETGMSLRVKTAGLTARYHPRVAVEHIVPASRLALPYFEQRSYFQGVANSYTDIRAGGQVGGPPGFDAHSIVWIKQFLRDVVSGRPSGADAMKRRTSTAYRTGYLFHYEAVRRDPLLLAWVLRQDYLDYQLPPGAVT